MVDNMKNVVLFFLVMFFMLNNAGAQYVRKIKEPDFFIPYKDRMHKPEVLNKIKKIKKTINKTYKKNQKDNISFNKTPYYKTIYDNYIKDINGYLITKKFEENEILENDLLIMNNGEIFEIKDDISNSIDTKEQYDFYMLAKQILEN